MKTHPRYTKHKHPGAPILLACRPQRTLTSSHVRCANRQAALPTPLPSPQETPNGPHRGIEHLVQGRAYVSKIEGRAPTAQNQRAYPPPPHSRQRSTQPSSQPTPRVEYPSRCRAPSADSVFRLRRRRGASPPPSPASPSLAPLVEVGGRPRLPGLDGAFEQGIGIPSLRQKNVSLASAASAHTAHFINSSNIAAPVSFFFLFRWQQCISRQIANFIWRFVAK